MFKAHLPIRATLSAFILMEIKEKIAKFVYTLESIETARGWTLSQRDKALLCYSCKSPLFYIEVMWGIVDETRLYDDFKVIGRNHKQQYNLREVGFSLHCAECGKFEESYCKYFYPKEKLVCSWNDKELEYAEKEEISFYLSQFNKVGNFKPSYFSSELKYLKEKLNEYESNFQNKKRGSRNKKKRRSLK